ncbi:MAG: MFS transporter [Puniceicoccaceae bacterium]
MKGLYEQFQGRGKDSLLHRNLRMCTEEGVFATPFIVLAIPGNVFIASLLTSVLGISESLYGFIVSLPSWANALQILLIPLLSRHFSARTLSIYLALINVFLWLLLAGTLHRLPLEDPDLVGRLMVLYFVAISLTQSLAGVSWMSWIQEWIPGRLRGKYFGRRNRILGLVTVAFILGTTEVFSQLGESMLAFQIILGVTCAFRLLSVYTLTHIYTPWSHPEKMIHEGWFTQYTQLLKPGPFRTYLLFAAILAFSLSLTGPFAPVFMTRHLDFPVVRQTHLLILASLSSALAMPLWGKLCDKHGCRPVIIFSSIFWMTQNYLWVILTPGSAWLLYPMWIWGGAFSGGVVLGGFNLVLKLTPTHLKTSGVSVHLAITSVAAAIPPILAGWFLGTAFLSGLDENLRYRMLFLLSPTLILLSLFLLSRVDEPKAASLSSFSGSFRTMRQILVQNGFLLAGNLTFFRYISKNVKTVIAKAGRKSTADPD